MARVIFYEKPGCGTNARQKQRLTAAGHVVEAKSLLTEPWTAARLRAFFGPTPVTQWFNAAAPRVKSGEIDPAAMSESAALAAMLGDPLLIRRPLIECEGQRCAGFDREPVLTLLGPQDERLEGCSRTAPGPCPTPDSPSGDASGAHRP